MLKLFETVLRVKSSSRFKSSPVTSPLVSHELPSSSLVGSQWSFSPKAKVTATSGAWVEVGNVSSARLSKLGSLSRDVFERSTSSGSELFSLLVCLDANKFVLLSLFSPLKTIYSRVSTKPLPNDAKSSLPVDVRRSKTLLLKLPIDFKELNEERQRQRW